jgi:ABC-type phosphate transport system substrate-binding protein
VRGKDGRILAKVGAAAALLLLLSGFATGAGPGDARADEPSATFRVIVHPATELAGADRAFIAEAFLDKVTRWSDGSAIHAVDLRFNAPTRHDFSEQILRRSVIAVRRYWQQRIFTGRGVPPPELASDEAVLEYVRRHPGAVGYVSVAAATSGVKVVPIH